MYMKIKKAAIFFDPARESCSVVGASLGRAAERSAVKYYFADYEGSLNDLEAGTDIIFSVGGDGTILKTARAAAKDKIKILGINAGNLGFLAAAERGLDFDKLFDDIKKDNFISQRRMMLNCRVYRDGAEVFGDLALNEAAVKAVSARSIKLSARYCSLPIKDYTGDGLLAATPTGSTAYNLAAGGPIVMPELDVFILTPICPHTLNQRPLLLPSGGDIRIKVLSERPRADAALSLDGQLNFSLNRGDEILISAYKDGVNILFPKGYDFFNILSIKLKWGSR